jgi:hypothetical protein
VICIFEEGKKIHRRDAENAENKEREEGRVIEE